MKLIIQIPCRNEEGTLPRTLRDLPSSVPGVDEVETLVVNDGSRDRTVEVAQVLGVDHIVDLPCHRGLAFAWSAGLCAALQAGADIIVNTDADNQYCGEDIPLLVRPILERKADVVIGSRPIEDIEHFSWLKKRLQRLGSWVVSRAAGVRVPDATSGFRAYSRQAALMLNVGSQYTYTLDTIVRAARNGLKIETIQVRVNGKLRESRLMRSTMGYVWRQGVDLLRVFTHMVPLKVFLGAASVPFVLGTAGWLRFLYYYFTGQGGGHVQSVVLSTMLVIIAFLIGVVGLVADMIAGNRRLIEDCLVRLKRMEAERAESPNIRPLPTPLRPEQERARESGGAADRWRA